jgi:peptidoglycan/LPS O-acetylase OafA/YrhL
MMQPVSTPESIPGEELRQPTAPAGQSFRLGYRKSLDGIRGTAILLVILAHLNVVKDHFGSLGVNAFFVLSGFLITCILVEEWDNSGGISLRNFYARRGLRLLPPLIAVLAVFVTLEFLTEPMKGAIRTSGHALKALFYYTNWAQTFRFSRTSIFAHTWSLSIEEQFYLVWPIILIFLLRRTSRTSSLCWILLLTFFSVLARIAVLTIEPGTQYGIRRVNLGLDTRADSLLLGCFAGMAISSRLIPQTSYIKMLFRWGSMLSIAGLLFIGVRIRAFDPGMSTFGLLAASFFAAVVIAHLVIEFNSPQHRILEFAPLVFLGKISYGLYLWHYPILKIMQRHDWPGWHLAYLPITVGVTLASYYWLELPCLRLKNRFQQTEKTGDTYG